MNLSQKFWLKLRCAFGASVYLNHVLMVRGLAGYTLTHFTTFDRNAC